MIIDVGNLFQIFICTTYMKRTWVCISPSSFLPLFCLQRSCWVPKALEWNWFTSMQKRSAVVANFPGVVSLFYLDAIVLEICSKMWYLFWIMNPTVKLGAISKRDAAFFKLHMYFCPFLVPLEKNKMAHKIWHILLANRNTVRIVWPWKTTWYKLQLSINIKLLSKKQRNIS